MTSGRWNVKLLALTVFKQLWQPQTIVSINKPTFVWVLKHILNNQLTHFGQCSWHILDSQLARCSQWLKLLISHIFISCLLKGFVYYRTSRLLHLYHPSTKQLRAFEMFIHLLRILESLSVFHTEIFEHNAEATIISTFSSSSSARSGDWVVDFWCWRFVCLETYTSFFLLYFLCSFEMVHG